MLNMVGLASALRILLDRLGIDKAEGSSPVVHQRQCRAWFPRADRRREGAGGLQSVRASDWLTTTFTGLRKLKRRDFITLNQVASRIIADRPRPASSIEPAAPSTAFNRLKDFRRIATRCDKLARNYLASVCLSRRTVSSAPHHSTEFAYPSADQKDPVVGPSRS
jgi:hypothetical protein